MTEIEKRTIFIRKENLVRLNLLLIMSILMNNCVCF